MNETLKIYELCTNITSPQFIHGCQAVNKVRKNQGNKIKIHKSKEKISYNLNYASSHCVDIFQQ